MTIKKQFVILATIIITLPILSALFIFVQNYIRSSERVLIREVQELKNTSSDLYTKDEWHKIRQYINGLPPDVETILVSGNGDVLISTVPEIKKENTFSVNQLWTVISQTSDIYYYQYTSLNFESAKCYFITRVPKIKKPMEKRPNIITSLLIFLMFIVLICVCILIKIFKNISRSIISLEKKTQDVANGELNVAIDSADTKGSNEISSLSKSIEKMRCSLVEAQNQKNKFIMGISHDLRTPVAIIKGYTEALSDSMISDKDEIKQTYNLIFQKATQLESMIDTLINYMKMNNIEIREQLKMNNITALIKTFCKESELSASVFKRKVLCQIDLQNDIYVPLSPQLLNRAFENLFSNAIRYTKENDLITLMAYEKDSKIYFIVKDNGVGINKEDISNIFDIFYRGTNSRREEGMGIGLSVVKNIIDTHGWTIGVESEKDKGTEFTITIPYSKETDSKTKAPESSENK
ncbi:MAG: HAMP domain-containing histidine kinase [Treponema sp.]|nr:HAMP domain-containing histidine kinase [Treponema sp.]